jgi:hypothetical protein
VANEFWSADCVSTNVVLDALRPGGVTICAKRLAGAGCELPKIERDGEPFERPMSSSGLWWDDDDAGVFIDWLFSKSHFNISHDSLKGWQRHLSHSSKIPMFYQNDLAMRNTAEISGKYGCSPSQV